MEALAPALSRYGASIPLMRDTERLSVALCFECIRQETWLRSLGPLSQLALVAPCKALMQGETSVAFAGCLLVTPENRHFN